MRTPLNAVSARHEVSPVRRSADPERPAKPLVQLPVLPARFQPLLALPFAGCGRLSAAVDGHVNFRRPHKEHMKNACKKYMQMVSVMAVMNMPSVVAVVPEEQSTKPDIIEQKKTEAYMNGGKPTSDVDGVDGAGDDCDVDGGYAECEGEVDGLHRSYNSQSWSPKLRC